jgi:hypothetical protein
LSMTFEVITPFLKGFHLSLCSHLSSRTNCRTELSSLTLTRNESRVS